MPGKQPQNRKEPANYEKSPVASFSRLAKLENRRPRLKGCCFENPTKNRNARFRSLRGVRLEPITDSYRVSVVLQGCQGGVGRGAGVGRGLGVGLGREGVENWNLPTRVDQLPSLVVR